MDIVIFKGVLNYRYINNTTYIEFGIYDTVIHIEEKG